MKTIKGRICTKRYRIRNARACYQGLRGTPRAYARRACVAARHKDRHTCRVWLNRLQALTSGLCARQAVFAAAVIASLTN
jgi:hypothetical protein